jgi:hypothetical protein
MDARQIIDQVQAAGAKIQIEGQHIAVEPVSLVSDSLRYEISKNRDAVFNILQTKLDALVELAVSKAWSLHEYRVAESEVLRVIGDTSGLADVSAAELDGWASALALRTVQARQVIPTGWEKVANCRYCGPVWSEHELPTLSCGWCWMRATGKWFPRP